MWSEDDGYNCSYAQEDWDCFVKNRPHIRSSNNNCNLIRHLKKADRKFHESLTFQC